MRRLLGLGRCCPSCHLPLTEAGAVQLVDALLQDSPGDRTAGLTALLIAEPPLALWGVCRAGLWCDHPPDGLEELAIWLGSHGLTASFWDEPLSQSALVTDRGLLQPWAAWAEEACSLARCAARLAGEPETGLTFLCGLLQHAPDWLTSCGAPAEIISSGVLPGWLTDWLQQLQGTQTPGSSPSWVAQARQQLAAGRSADIDGVRVDPAPKDLAKDSGTIRQRWLDSADVTGRWLPGLIHRLDRLRSLESEFSTLLEREKLAALKELAYGASHEINNPLANISTRAQTLMRDEPDPERRRKLAVINAQAFRAHEMISDMMLFARPPMLERSLCDLTAMADRVIAELLPDARAQGTSLMRVTSDDPVVVSADGNHLSVALKALCTNSLEAVGRDGRIEVSVRPVISDPQPVAAEDSVEILISDNGPGISPHVRRHLFDPYFSGREAGRGLGLGLSKCWAIVDQHGGRIRVDSQPGCGTIFSITLPVEACTNTPTAY